MSTDPSRGGVAVWLAGLVVVVAAGAATAHGLYEVALGSRTPAGIAWLYPVITDGLALVAYASTTRLAGPARRYAWGVVVLAAGLSGLAQATYLADAVGTTPAALRFGVGAWPAIAAAIAAHLLFLIGTSRASLDTTEESNEDRDGTRPTVQPSARSVSDSGVQPALPAAPADGSRVIQLDTNPARSRTTSPRDRALAFAREHASRNGSLPSVRELEALAHVSRGTAATALQALRSTRNGHHLDPDDQPEGPTP